MVAVPEPYLSDRREEAPTGPYHHRHAYEPPERQGRQGRRPGVLLAILVAVLVILAGAGIAVVVALRDQAPPAGALPAPKGAPVSVRLGDTIVFRARSSSANFTLSAGAPIAEAPGGPRPTNGSFFALPVAVQVVAGSVFVIEDDFVLVTAAGRAFEPDMTFAFDDGLRGTRAASGQKVTGLVVWDLPPGAETGAKVELRLGDDGLQGHWQLP